jgi:hypothetical protein
MKIRWRCCVVVSIMLVSGLLLGLGCQSQARSFQTVTERIEINTPADSVYEAIRKERDARNHNRHLVGPDGPHAVIKEKVENVPIYGKVNCLWQENEVSSDRIDYTLLESDKFKAGFGSWVLLPGDEKKSTILELSSFIDTGLYLPFAAELTRMAGHGNARQRLEYIKASAEALYAEALRKGIEAAAPPMPSGK